MIRDILDWTDAELDAFLELPAKIDPPQITSSSKDISCMEDSNLESLLVTAEFILLFKTALRDKKSKKTFYPKRLKRVSQIVKDTKKFKPFLPYLTYLASLTKSDYQLSRLLNDCTECLYGLYEQT